MKFPTGQQGFSLLELLIALIILTIGLLGFAQAEIASLRDAQTAYFQSMASLQAAGMAERLRGCGNLKSNCVSREKTDWQSETKTLLPNVTSEVSPCHPDCKISLQWGVVSIGKPKLDNNKFAVSTQP